MHVQFATLLLLSLAAICAGHGYIKNPPARNSMWRFGFKNPKNYDDDGLYCGGLSVFNEKNNRKCGVCGDPYHLKNQPHMDGGRYANNIIGQTYKEGSVIAIQVMLTTAHYGFFQFRIGDFSNTRTEGDSTGRLKGYLLESADGSGDKFKIHDAGHNNKLYTMRVKLPRGLKCERCVLQWWYKGGNNWGCDKNVCGMGHGDQEHFVNCADVKITA